MLPSPLLALSPSFCFLERTLSSFRGALRLSTPSRLVATRSILSGLTSYISGGASGDCASGFAKVVSAKGTRCRLAFGCWAELSEVRCRRRLLRVRLAGPPSWRAGENIFAVDYDGSGLGSGCWWLQSARMLQMCKCRAGMAAAMMI